MKSPDPTQDPPFSSEQPSPKPTNRLGLDGHISRNLHALLDDWALMVAKYRLELPKATLEDVSKMVGTSNSAEQTRNCQRLEMIIGQYAPIEEVEWRIGVARQKLESLASPGYVEHIDRQVSRGAPSEETDLTKKEKRVRSQFLALTREVYRVYSLKKAHEDERTSVIIRATRTFVVALLLWLSLLVMPVRLGAGGYGGVSILSWCVAAGLVGSYISMVRRIQQVDFSSITPRALFILSASSKVTIVTSVIFGTVFPVLLILLCLSGLLTGACFPTVKGFEQLFGGYDDFVGKVHGTSGPRLGLEQVNLAKMLLWGFLAGFGERLVPDVVDRVISERSQTKAGG